MPAMNLLPNGYIRAVLFDLDDTLCHHRPRAGEIFNAYVASLGIPLNSEDVQRATRWEHYYFANSPEIRVDKQQHQNQTFEVNSFWISFSRRRLNVLGCSPAQATELAPQVAQYMIEHYHHDVFVPNDAYRLLDYLHQAGYILGTVSNRNHPYDHHLEALGLRQYFHFTLAGGEIQSFKPEPAIFEEALRRANTSPAETLYIGDNYFADIIGARRAGLWPVLYDPDGVFPEADCPTISSFDQLMTQLK